MGKNTKHWLRAIRLVTLSASIIPITLGGVLAAKEGSFHVLYFILSLISMVFFQISANLINDVDDFTENVDTIDSFGSSRVIVDNLLDSKKVLSVGIAFFTVACIIGFYLAYIGGTAIIIIGLLGASSAYFYTRKPFSLKYKGLGLPLVFLTFGPLPSIGTYCLLTGHITMEIIILSIPIGLITTAILHVNDLRDIEHDKKAGIKTFAMIVGKQNAKYFYIALLATSYITILILFIAGELNAWGLIVFLGLPLAYILIKGIESEQNLKTLDQKTALFQLAFGALLLIAVANK